MSVRNCRRTTRQTPDCGTASGRNLAAGIWVAVCILAAMLLTDTSDVNAASTRADIVILDSDCLIQSSWARLPMRSLRRIRRPSTESLTTRWLWG